MSTLKKFIILGMLIFYTACSAIADEITGADIFFTPLTGSNIVDGYIGGDLFNSEKSFSFHHRKDFS